MKIEKNILVIYKNNGKFYNTVGLDSYILNYIFGYKVLKGDRCGFPDNVVDSVKSKLNELMISYQIVYSDRNPLIVEFENKNKYKNYALNAKKNSVIKKRIADIVAKLENYESKNIDIILDKIDDLLM